MKKSLKKEIKQAKKDAVEETIFRHKSIKLATKMVKLMDKYGYTNEQYSLVLEDGRKFTTANVIEDAQSAE